MAAWFGREATTGPCAAARLLFGKGEPEQLVLCLEPGFIDMVSHGTGTGVMILCDKRQLSVF